MIEGIPVEQLFKSDPMTAPKLVVIRGLSTYQDEDSNWAVDQVVRSIRSSVADLEVFDCILNNYRILTSVSNDPEHDKFDANDQFPLVYERIRKADIVLFSSNSVLGLPGANLTKLLERMGDEARESKREGSYFLFDDTKIAAVVLHGGCTVGHAAITVGAALNKLGFIVARHGLVFWDRGRGDIKSDKTFGEVLSRLAADIVTLAKETRS